MSCFSTFKYKDNTNVKHIAQLEEGKINYICPKIRTFMQHPFIPHIRERQGPVTNKNQNMYRNVQNNF
jgi:hypothetical protein